MTRTNKARPITVFGEWVGVELVGWVSARSLKISLESNYVGGTHKLRIKLHMEI